MMKLDKSRTLRIIKAALKEDIGTGDITTDNTIPKHESVKASIIANEDCILCGIDVAEWTMNSLDRSVRFKPQVDEGQHVYKGKEILFLEGHARSILTVERTMLNFLCLLSGIATRVSGFVEEISGLPAMIYDTRKTIPLLRYLEKYAVRVGGGHNHRQGLWDQVLIKDNHQRVANFGGGKNSLDNIRNSITKKIEVEVEVENLEQLKRMLTASPDIIMLDNMSVSDVSKAVQIRNGSRSGEKPLLEASGGITLENVREYAKTGVDRISIGSLTDSVESLDMSLEMVA
ncbi:MAG: carboxylating nicotinate-nucleotide diphosphorylase [Candidatus Omnitrophota bacterium]